MNTTSRILSELEGVRRDFRQLVKSLRPAKRETTPPVPVTEQVRIFTRLSTTDFERLLEEHGEARFEAYLHAMLNLIER